MNTNNSYLEAARAYAGGVCVLLAPSGREIGVRGGQGPASFTDLAARAEALSPVSERLTKESAMRLTHPEPAARIEAETALLAKALTDLEISGYLLQAAQDQESERQWGNERGMDRSAGSSQITKPYLAILLGKEEKSALDRAVAPRSLSAARTELILQSGDALALITARSADASQTALEGLVGLGASELAKAVGIVGLDIAKALGQAEKITQLYNLFRDFLFKAYNAFVALLGPQLSKIVGEQVTEWVEKISDGEPIPDLLEKLYETEETKEALQQEIETSKAKLDRFTAAIEQVGKLNDALGKQTNLVEKILPKLKWAALIPAAALPQGQLLMAAAYIVLSGYVILNAADYVDAPRLQRLDRVPGVRRVIETHLAIVKEA